ncbi:hypothetical protein [Effusibacillus pohliae]|uniref:hypothetical protein n=1 Tax=Effusibacillus pohliae TaxID=232270 RepID=UPI0003698CDD|nr:hypothetical protein [Effusibacillus pohliae]
MGSKVIETVLTQIKESPEYQALWIDIRNEILANTGDISALEDIEVPVAALETFIARAAFSIGFNAAVRVGVCADV